MHKNYKIRTGWFEKTWDQSQRQNLAPAIYKRSKLALDHIRLTMVEFFADNSRKDTLGLHSMLCKNDTN